MHKQGSHDSGLLWFSLGDVLGRLGLVLLVGLVGLVRLALALYLPHLYEGFPCIPRRNPACFTYNSRLPTTSSSNLAHTRMKTGQSILVSLSPPFGQRIINKNFHSVRLKPATVRQEPIIQWANPREQPPSPHGQVNPVHFLFNFASWAVFGLGNLGMAGNSRPRSLNHEITVRGSVHLTFATYQSNST